MKVIFVSNYYNHHQSALSEAFYALTGGAYRFIETEEMTEERKKMGWGRQEKPSFVLRYDNDAKNIQKLIDEADFVILGSAPDALLKQRHREKKISFRYSERFYKKGCPLWQLPLRTIKNYLRFGRYKNDYMLCSSAYTAADLAITKTFINKTYKWGYFPAVTLQDLTALFKAKKENKPLSILWVSRLIEWKHPEAAILVAEKLKQDGCRFLLNMIGNGEKEEELTNLIAAKHLEGYVKLLGAMKPEEVRTYMEKADIFLFTSDFNEGWGAVLNESMNSGCAVVASHAIGSAPFLIHNGENGIIYKNGDQEGLYHAVKKLAENPELRKSLGVKAYYTMFNTWNAKVAAERFLRMAAEIEKHGVCNLFETGPCSKAGILKNEWYDNRDK